MKAKSTRVRPETIDASIITVRGQKVLLDADLAAIYGVTTKALNQAVKRNADRFPADFAFQLTPAGKREVVTNCDHLSRLKFSPVLPYAFTETAPHDRQRAEQPGGCSHKRLCRPRLREDARTTERHG